MASDHVFHQKNWGMSTKRNNKSTTSSPNSSRNCTLHIFCWRFVWNYLEVSSRKLGDVERKQLVSSACAIKSRNGGQEVNLQLHHGKLCQYTHPATHALPPGNSVRLEHCLLFWDNSGFGCHAQKKLWFRHGPSRFISDRCSPFILAIFPILAGHSWRPKSFDSHDLRVFFGDLCFSGTRRTYTSSCSEHRWRRHPCSWRSYPTTAKVYGWWVPEIRRKQTTWEWC